MADIEMEDKESGDLRFVIETPRGSRNKYKYMPKENYYELAVVLPEGMTFPIDFGFVPSTLGGDGDALDVLVLMDAPVPLGTVIKGRLIGALTARQKENDGQWQRNDRLIAVATRARTHETIKNITDLRPNTVTDIKEFFINYNKLHGRKFEIDETCGPNKASKLLKIGMAMYQKKRKKS